MSQQSDWLFEPKRPSDGVRAACLTAVFGGSAALIAALEGRGGLRQLPLSAAADTGLIGYHAGSNANDPAELVFFLSAAVSPDQSLDAALRLVRSAWPVLAERSGSICLVVEEQLGLSRALTAMVRSLAREAGGCDNPFRVNAIEVPAGTAGARIVDAIEFVVSADAGFVSGAWLRLDPADRGGPRPAAPVLVTGASDGIGAACAQRLAADGFEVIVTGRESAPTEAVAARILEAGGVATAMLLDATIRDDWQRAIDKVGPLGGVVSNVGACRLGPTPGLTEADIALMLQANVASNMNALDVALRAIEAGGRMVFTGSVAALKAAPGNAAYSASKAAIVDLIELHGAQAQARDVRLHAIHPGLVFNDNVRRTQGEERAAALRDAIVGGTPLRRFAEAHDIAAAMAALISGRLALDPTCPLVCDGGFSA